MVHNIPFSEFIKWCVEKGGSSHYLYLCSPVSGLPHCLDQMFCPLFIPFLKSMKMFFHKLTNTFAYPVVVLFTSHKLPTDGPEKAVLIRLNKIDVTCLCLGEKTSLNLPVPVVIQFGVCYSIMLDSNHKEVFHNLLIFKC